MIENDERLIIVIGMAHSGTTILTHTLKQHPDIFIGVDGSEAWIFENTWLPKEQSEPIQALLNKYPDKRILLKRPWNCASHADWMTRDMPNAKYLYCLRPLNDIAASWSKPTSFIGEQLRNGGIDHQRDVYNNCLARAMQLKEQVPNFKIIEHQEFVNKPRNMINELTAWLGLPPHTFDISQVGKTDIKKFIRDGGKRVGRGTRNVRIKRK